MKLKEIAKIINGEIVGESEVEITGVSSISEAGEGDITYLSDNKWLKQLKSCNAAAVIIREPVSDVRKPQIIAKNPQLSFSKLLSIFYVKPHPYKGISNQAFVSDKALIGKNVTIYPFAYISEGAEIGAETIIYPGVFIGEDTKIGNSCLIYSNVTIREQIIIGNRVIIHAGAVIGADGFGYVFDNGIHHKIPQIGSVVIEDDVEIGANSTIDRATTDKTVIGKGTKVDNLVQIGHNVRIGKNVIIVAQTGIGGSSEIGDGVILGGQSAVSDHSTIEAGAMFGGRSGIVGKVSRGIYSGAPIIPHREWLKASAVFARLPELNKKIKELEEKIKALQGQ